MSEQLLRVDGVCAGYGASQVLDGTTFSMGREAVCIVGRNGMGKTTLCKTLIGLLKPSAGEIEFEGSRIDGSHPERVARKGIAYVPQGRRLFPSLTVDEHLAMLARGARGKTWDADAVYELFPRLAERRKNGGAELSAFTEAIDIPPAISPRGNHLIKSESSARQSLLLRGRRTHGFGIVHRGCA